MLVLTRSGITGIGLTGALLIPLFFCSLVLSFLPTLEPVNMYTFECFRYFPRYL